MSSDRIDFLPGSISAYLREIGRGKEGARDLTREQAADLLGQVLDGRVTDLEVGAFCIAMRVKGESADEMAGFLDATQARLDKVPAGRLPLVVLPSCNGARRLPLLTPLLGLLLAREGLPVLIHGTPTESGRVSVEAVLQALDIAPLTSPRAVQSGELSFLPTPVLSPALARLLAVRRTLGLRNPAHSLVKQMNPCDGDALIVSSYTHPEYAVSMADVFGRMGSTGLLLRGTEGEPVADPRRQPEMRRFLRGRLHGTVQAQAGALTALPDLPIDTDPAGTARYTRQVLQGQRPVPAPIRTQVECIVRLHLDLHRHLSSRESSTPSSAS